MGCDGGTIPTRDELVRTKKKPEQKDKDSERLYRWQHCRLTQSKLVKPIVACELGRLYNKEAIIEKLLNEKSEGESSPVDKIADHIKSLKDVRELQLTDNPSSNAKSLNGPSVGDGYVDKLVSPWICPITGLEMNGKFKFVMNWADGRVVSERALKILDKDETAKIERENIIVLNPEENGDEESQMRQNMLERRAKAKAAKKAAKETKKRNSEKNEEDPSASKKSKSNHNVNKNGKVPTDNKNGTSSKPKTIQDDKTKSEVFKSIFTSHPSAANKPKPHWVTFDPRYN